MIKIFLVRHGQTVYNIQHRIQGWCDSPLTELGIQQAKELSEKLKDISFVGVYSSPLKRAYLTAQYIVKEKQDVQTLNGLKELHFGSIEEKEDHLYIKKDGSSHREGFTKYGGETIAMVKQRMIDALREIVSKHQDGNILIVSHGAAIRYLLQEIKQSEEDYFIDNCEVTYIDYECGKFKCNDKKVVKGF